MIGKRFESQPVSYDEDIDRTKLESYTASGKKYLLGLTPDRACTILTICAHG